MENCVPVVVTTVDEKTMTVLFWETDLYEVVADLDEDELKKKHIYDAKFRIIEYTTKQWETQSLTEF